MKIEKSNRLIILLIIDYDDPYDQQQEWFSERGGFVTDATLARAVGFYNIYHQTWALIEQEKMIIHFENATFTYHNKFKEHMKVEGAVSEDIFNYLFDV